MKYFSEKDGKAYSIRIQKQLQKKYRSVPRYKVVLTLLYLEHVGLLTWEREDVQTYKKRMVAYPGLYERGIARKYYAIRDGLPSTHFGGSTPFMKYSYAELDREYQQELEYPV